MTGQSIGIDLSINGAHDCTVLDATGQLVQRFTFDSSAAGMQKLEQHLRRIDSSHGAPFVVMEPTGLAWFLPCLYLRAQHPEIKVVRIKTSKVAALRRYLSRTRSPIASIRSPWPRCRSWIPRSSTLSTSRRRPSRG